MAKTYRRHLGTRMINWSFGALTKLGLEASYRQILTVPGRKSGRPHSTPVDVIEVGGDRWLVAGYGPANWVLNTRAYGEVTLGRGGHSGTYKVEEVGDEDAIPVLRKYIDEIRVTRPYFDATPSSSDAVVAAELPRHPVFRLIPIQ
jgi:deazaflavin-dependent oxidoreductase (nitroreductase family)